MKIKFITVPYDSGHFNKRMGKGPIHIIESGLINHLRKLGHFVESEEIISKCDFLTEIATTFELIEKISLCIESTIENKSFPIVLSGNCNASIGTIAGNNKNPLGVLWFDAHGDCEIPETTTSGFLDGMGLSMLMGYSWQNSLSFHKENFPLAGKRITLIGARDLSVYEYNLINEAGINYISIPQIKESPKEIFEKSIIKFANEGVKEIHIHMDVDVYDPSISPANSFPVEHGLYQEDVIQIINYYNHHFPIASLGIASYDPACDKDNRMLNVISKLIEKVVELKR